MAGPSRTMLLSRVLVLCLMTSWSTAQEASISRLPEDLKPIHYDITIEPLMYDSNPTFNGKMIFKFHCVNATDRIVLHVKELNVSDISVASASQSSQTAPSYARHCDDKDRQFLKISLNRQLTAGLNYSVSMTFNATLNRLQAGFYLISYFAQSAKKYMASTQFLATDARRAFPCMDEPALKATFTLTIIRTTSNTAISNMPIKKSDDLGGDRVADQFVTTKQMSTCLLAFAVGDLDYRSATSRRGVPVEVWSRPEVVDQVEYALNYAVRVFDFFEDLFGVQYPLPKLSLLAVPQLATGGSAWGLITIEENSLLLDPAKASASHKHTISISVGQRLACTWFGNLVTPIWWDEVWLIEGFTSFVAYLAIDHVYPEWNVMDEFVRSYLLNAMNIDGGFWSRPIYFTVNTLDEIQDTITFDLLTHTKSACVIRMLCNAIGESTFWTGVKNYMNDLKYGSASCNDLWNALAEQSRRDGHTVDVGAFMDTWIMQMNYPIVTVTKQDNELTFTQHRFLDDRTATDPGTHASPYGYKWDIPVTYTTSENTDFSNKNIYWLTRHGRLTMMDWSLRSDSWVVTNLNMMGYYRVNYDTDNWARLTQQLKRNHTVIEAVNRAQIMKDAWSLFKGGYLQLPVALGLFEYLGNERDYIPLYAGARQLLYMDKMLKHKDIYEAFLAFIRDSMRSIYNQWRITASFEGLTLEQSNLKVIVNSMSCTSGVDLCKEDAIRLFAKWKQNPEGNPMDPRLQFFIYCMGMRLGSSDDWNFLFQRFKNETNGRERMIMQYSLAWSRNSSVLKQLLQEASFKDTFKIQDRMMMITMVADNEVGTPLAWEFVRDNWADLVDKYGEQPSLLSLVNTFGTYFKDKPGLEEFQKFVKSHDAFGTAFKVLDTVQETIRTNIDWMKQNYDPIKQWLRSQA